MRKGLAEARDQGAAAAPGEEGALSADEAALRRLGYAQELRRGMSGFSNYALSLSIICILAGGVTSFHIGYASVGGASIGLGWAGVPSDQKAQLLGAFRRYTVASYAANFDNYAGQHGRLGTECERH